MTNRTIAIVQARTSSSRLPGKVLLPFGSAASLVEAVVEPILQVLPRRDVFIATSTDPTDDALAREASRMGIGIFRGSLTDVLSRFSECARDNGADIVLRVCADNPFLQPSYCDELLTNWKSGDDYLSHCFPDGTPVILSHIGMFGELLSADSINRARHSSPSARNVEHPTTMHLERTGFCSRRFLPVPSPMAGRRDIRLTVDTPLDYSVLSPLHLRASQEQVIHRPNALAAMIDGTPGVLDSMSRSIASQPK